MDDLPECQPAGFFKLDVQAADLMVLRNGERTLRAVAVLQCEAEFLELYESQRLFADVESYLRKQGFAFLRFAHTMGRTFKPLSFIADPYRAMSQTLWADAIFMKDFRRRMEWSERILGEAAFVLPKLHDGYWKREMLLMFKIKAKADRHLELLLCFGVLGHRINYYSIFLRTCCKVMSRSLEAVRIGCKPVNTRASIDKY